MKNIKRKTVKNVRRKRKTVKKMKKRGNSIKGGSNNYTNNNDNNNDNNNNNNNNWSEIAHQSSGRVTGVRIFLKKVNRLASASCWEGSDHYLKVIRDDPSQPLEIRIYKWVPYDPDKTIWEWRHLPEYPSEYLDSSRIGISPPHKLIPLGGLVRGRKRVYAKMM